VTNIYPVYNSFVKSEKYLPLRGQVTHPEPVGRIRERLRLRGPVLQPALRPLVRPRPRKAGHQPVRLLRQQSGTVSRPGRKDMVQSRRYGKGIKLTER